MRAPRLITTASPQDEVAHFTVSAKPSGPPASAMIGLFLGDDEA
jgi:hypothetical protein